MLQQCVNPSSTANPTYVLGEAAPQNAVMYLSGGAIFRADPSFSPPGSVVGLMQGGSSAVGSQVQIIAAQQIVHGFSGLTVDALYFLGPEGTLTNAPPDVGLWQPVGWAITPHSLSFKLYSCVMRV